jgi:hypothetical protein
LAEAKVDVLLAGITNLRGCNHVAPQHVKIEIQLLEKVIGVVIK